MAGTLRFHGKGRKEQVLPLWGSTVKAVQTWITGTYVKRHAKSKHPADLCRVILIEKTDRLYRNFKDWVTLDVDELNLEVHLVKENDILSAASRSSGSSLHRLPPDSIAYLNCQYQNVHNGHEGGNQHIAIFRLFTP